ncbi:hypothetical protein [Amycolatopsis sp. EV170708-02-1]|uniref:hypothetical protein n=1 Tax=Amycolatopsis sp. EV170708-02-1 TaxID=2919322 RepID=UPI001F0C5696|nr:hypothetical protein [Amycolatopsis sp. EV170708-02-1]UMP00015.1 hypothetical protein MJQ72_26285 [Amycolatopsis sp. EV170708-02-1]
MNVWLQAGLSLGVGLLTAGGALIGVRHVVRGNDRATEQRELAARREEWWRRFAWAADLALSDDSPAKQTAGLQLLVTLAESDLAQRDESQLLYVFQKRLLDELLRDHPDPQEEATQS